MNAQYAIQQLREHGWSDGKIARAVGCSQPTITRIRHGYSDPRESTARTLETLLASQSPIDQIEPNQDATAH